MNLTLSRFYMKCQEYTILVPGEDCLVSFQHFTLLKIHLIVCVTHNRTFKEALTTLKFLSVLFKDPTCRDTPFESRISQVEI